MLKCLKALISNSNPTQHPLLRCILSTERQWGKGSAVLKKIVLQKTTGMRFYKQYLDEIAPVPPSPRQAQRNQVLLRHFSLSRCLLCHTKMRQRGIQHHLKGHNKHKLLFQQTVRLSFAIWFIPRDLFQKDSGLFWDGVVGGG